MIDISKLSDRYELRRLDVCDADAVLALCKGNPQFYRYCEAEPTAAQVRKDLTMTPPGKDRSDKYFVGFYERGTLVAVLDLIDGYPAPDVAYFGLFMVARPFQGQQRGSAIVHDAAAYLKSAGKTTIRLSIDKMNPQSTHFWKKHGFQTIKEVDRNGWPMLVAELRL